MTSGTTNFDYLALKNEGNALYSAGDFLGAVQKYSKALIICTDNNTDRTTLLKNRAAAYLNLQEYQKVIEDTTAALEITPSDIKALYRRCRAYEQLGKYNEAFEDARAVNRLHPQNSAIQPYLRRLQEIIKESIDDVFDINSLPDEIILKIFGYLEQNQLGQIARVCSRWNVLTRSPALWKKVDVTFHWSHKSHNTMTRCFANMLPSCVTSIRLYYSNFDWTEQLNFDELRVRLQKRCPRLEALILEHVHLSDNFSSVIGSCSQFLPGLKILIFRHSTFSDSPTKREFDGISKIEVLDVSDCNLGGFQGLQFSKMPELRVLNLRNTRNGLITVPALQNHGISKIEVLDVSDCNLGVFKRLQFSKMPQLRVLNLRNTSIGSRTFRALQNHGHNLEELYLCGTFIFKDDLEFSNSVFPHLKIICLHCRCATRNAIVSVIESCQSLQKVYIRKYFVQNILILHPFSELNKCKYNIVEGVDEHHSHNLDYSYKKNSM